MTTTEANDMIAISWFSNFGRYGTPGTKTFQDPIQAVRFARTLAIRPEVIQAEVRHPEGTQFFNRADDGTWVPA